MAKGKTTQESEHDIWIEAVAKLIRLTHEDQLAWKRVELLNDSKQEIDAYIAKYKGRRLKLSERENPFDEENFKRMAQYRSPKSEIEKTLDFFKSIKNTPLITLEFVDENEISLWRFPQTSALRDLMSSVRYQSANVKEFLKDILNEG
jgi:hypothetical protein